MGQRPRLASPDSRQQPFQPASVRTEAGATRTPKTNGTFVGPLGAKVQLPSSSLLDIRPRDKRSTARPIIHRRDSVARSRMDLPILAEEQAIVEAIRMCPVVVIAGETGSGKTTQVPQMLYEAGFGFKESGKISVLKHDIADRSRRRRDDSHHSTSSSGRRLSFCPGQGRTQSPCLVFPRCPSNSIFHHKLSPNRNQVHDRRCASPGACLAATASSLWMKPTNGASTLMSWSAFSAGLPNYVRRCGERLKEWLDRFG